VFIAHSFPWLDRPHSVSLAKGLQRNSFLEDNHLPGGTQTLDITLWERIRKASPLWQGLLESKVRRHWGNSPLFQENTAFALSISTASTVVSPKKERGKWDDQSFTSIQQRISYPQFPTQSKMEGCPK
jgi:hypothetical protein